MEKQNILASSPFGIGTASLFCDIYGANNRRNIYISKFVLQRRYAEPYDIWCDIFERDFSWL